MKTGCLHVVFQRTTDRKGIPYNHAVATLYNPPNPECSVSDNTGYRHDQAWM